MRAELDTRGGAAVAAYAGSARGSAALAPAIRVLCAALRGGRLVLLWPADVPVPALVAAAAGGRVVYAPADASAAPLGARALKCEPAARALARERAVAAIVFAEPGHAPDVPAYVSYLAGVEVRAALAAELSGAVLSLAVALPAMPLPAEERHLYLVHRVLSGGGGP